MARPDLSYYFGRPVTEITAAPADNTNAWEIKLNDASIRNLMEGNPVPDAAIIGSAFLTATGLAADEIATCTFGYSLAPTDTDPGGSITTVAEVVFGPKGYEIHDPTMGDEYVVVDESVESEDSLPLDPSGDRVADGPADPGSE